LSSTVAGPARTRSAKRIDHRGYRGDASAFTVAVLSLMLTLIAAYDLCLLAISWH
jgi:hypothetical protein